MVEQERASTITSLGVVRVTGSPGYLTSNPYGAITSC